MAKARSSKGLLLPPASTPNFSETDRTRWLTKSVAGFVTKGQANRTYYEVILNALWPSGPQG